MEKKLYTSKIVSLKQNFMRVFKFIKLSDPFK